MSENDRQSIGLTDQSQRLMDDILARGWFSAQQDVARLALACALRAGIAPSSTTGVDTRWSSGLFDPSGEILSLIGAFYPDVTTPVRAAESLVNAGLPLIHEQLVTKGMTPDALVA